MASVLRGPAILPHVIFWISKRMQTHVSGIRAAPDMRAQWLCCGAPPPARSRAPGVSCRRCGPPLCAIEKTRGFAVPAAAARAACTLATASGLPTAKSSCLRPQIKNALYALPAPSQKQEARRKLPDRGTHGRDGRWLLPGGGGRQSAEAHQKRRSSAYDSASAYLQRLISPSLSLSLCSQYLPCPRGTTGGKK
jgi:hypothetical protein